MSTSVKDPRTDEELAASGKDFDLGLLAKRQRDKEAAAQAAADAISQARTDAEPGNAPGGSFVHRSTTVYGDALPSVSEKPTNGWLDQYKESNRMAYDQPAYQARMMDGVKEKADLMGPSDPQNPEADALSARGRQIYSSSLNQLARASIPKSILDTTNLQTQDVNNRSAIYSNIQARAQINYKETLIKREHALGVAIMQRELYGSLFTGIAKTTGSVTAGIAATMRTPSKYGYSADPYSNPYSAGGDGSGFSPDSSIPDDADGGTGTNLPEVSINE